MSTWRCQLLDLGEVGDDEVNVVSCDRRWLRKGTRSPFQPSECYNNEHGNDVPEGANQEM